MKSTNFLIFLIIIFVHAIYFILLGEHYTNDHIRYLQYADGLRNGFYFDAHNFWYITYCYFLLCVRFFTDNLIFIIVCQGVIQSISLFLFYLAINELTENRLVSLFALLMIISFPDFMQWFCYVLPESLYVSLLFILVYVLINWIKHKEKSSLVLLFPVIVITALVKPTAIGIFFSATILFQLNISLKKLGVWRFTVSHIFLLFVGILLLNKMLTTYGLIEEYKLGEVIYGASIVTSDFNAASMVIDSSGIEVAHLLDKNQQVLNVIQFVWENPIYWFKLFSLKVFTLLISIRPYWSNMHNLFNILYLLPLYSLAACGFSTVKQDKVSFSLLIAFITFQILAVGFTTNDWDGRFLLPILVAVYFFAAMGINRLLNHFLSKQT